MKTETELKYGTIEDYNAKSYDKRFIFVLNHYNPTPSLTGKYFPNNVSIPMIDEIFDPKKGMKRIIRYIPGESSIYVDEQSPDDKFPKKSYYLEFGSTTGEIVVDGKERKKLEYMLATNSNGSNPNRDETIPPKFFLVDLKSGLKKKMDSEKILHQAKEWCYQADWEKLKAYARVLNISINNDSSSVRWDMIRCAEKDPKKFLDGTNNELTDRKSHILEAIDMGILILRPTTNSIEWAEGGTIVVSPLGKDPIDHLTDVSFTADGQRTYAVMKDLLIKRVMSEDFPVSEIPNVPTEKARAEIARVEKVIAIKSNEEILEIVAASLDKGVIIKDKGYYIYGDKKFLIMGFARILKSNKELLMEIKGKI